MDIFTCLSSSYPKIFLRFSIVLLSLGFFSQVSFAQDCTGVPFITGGLNNVNNGDACSNVAISPGIMRVIVAGVNDVDNPSNVSFVVNWNDGSAIQTVGPGAPITWNGVGTHSYTVDVPHLFPPSGVNAKCEYFPTAQLRVAGTVCPASLGTPPRFIRWNTDNQGSGILTLSETTTSKVSYPVCPGQPAAVTFTDRSTLNCINSGQQAGGAPFNSFERRWRQFVYGTGGSNIAGVLVNGVAVGANFAGAVVDDFPTNTTLPAPVATLPITVPPGATVGQFYEITMRYWNYCNPFPGTPVTTTAQILIIAQPPPLVPAAASSLCYAASTAGKNFTVSGTNGALTTAVNWYNKNPFTGGGVALPNGAVSTNFPLTSYQSPALGGTGSGVNTSLGGAPGAGGVYSVWATQVYGVTNTCESQPVEVVYIVKPQLVPATPAGSNLLCNGSAGVPYTVTAAPALNIPAGNFTNAAQVNFTTQYAWTASPAAGITIAPTTGNAVAVTYGISPEPSPFATVNIQAGLEFSDGTCLTAPNQIAVHVDGKSAITNISAGSTICSGSTTGAITVSGITGTITGWEVDPGTGTFGVDGSLGTGTSINPTLTALAPTTYRFRADVTNGSCAPATSPVASVLVNPIPPQPVITPSGPTTFCASSSVTLSSSNNLASTYQWFLNGSAVAGATSQTYLINSAAQSGSYTVRTVGVAPSSCPSPLSSPVVVTVEPLPSAANPTGGGAVCGGNPAPDIVWVLTGTAPFSVTYTANGIPTTAPTATNTFTIVAPSPAVTTTYQITAISDANSCPATTFGGTAKVTIGGTAPTLTSPFVVTPAEACFSAASPVQPSLTFKLDPGSASQSGFTLVYKIDGGGNASKTFNTDAASLPSAIKFTETALNTTAPSPHVITIVSIQSPATCQTIFNTALNFQVDPLPAAPTGPTGSTYCSSGAPTAISVTAPAAGLTIDWYAAATGGAVLAGGTGTASFTPSTFGTYFAETRNTTTSCVSATRTSVQLKIDNAPAAAAAGPDQNNLCAGSATLAATTPTNAGVGTWTSVTPGLTFTPNKNTPVATVTGLPQNPANGAPKLTTLTWTVVSALGVCAPTSDDVVLTVNPLPKAVLYKPSLCEDVPGGGSAAGVLLSNFNDSVTAIVGSADRAVAYFSDAVRTVNVTSTPQTITNGKVYFTSVNVISTNCSAVGTITFSVVSAPSAVNKTLAFCEDVAAGIPQGKATGINLTSNDVAVSGGAPPATRSIEWYTDPSLGAGFRIPVGAAAGQESNYTLTGSTTLYAKIIDVTSLTKCFNVAKVVMTLNKRPLDNPITGNSTVCKDPSNIVFYQADFTINPGSTYTWTVTGTAGSFVVFGGGGTNSPTNFFILLEFPQVGTVTITMQETVNGCVGNVNTKTVNVVSAPPATTITGPLQVCNNQLGVIYSVGSPNPLSLYTWTVAGATVEGPGSGVGLSSITVDYGVLSGATINVKETSSSGCAGPDATDVIVVNPQPNMTSSTTAAVCSGATPALVFTADKPSTFKWKVTSITGSVTGTSVGATGTGNLSTVFTGAGALKNATGVVASVAIDVTPTATAAPNCVGNVQSVTLSVNPEPVLASPQTKTICSGAQVNYEILLTPLNLPAGTVFNWAKPTMSDGSTQGTAGANVSSGTPGTIHITDILVNTTGAAITATYNITPNSGPPTSCAGTPKPVVITVNPQPILSATLNATRCSQTTIGLTLATAVGSVAANNYNITSITIPAGLTAGPGNKLVPATGVANNYLANDTYTNFSSSPLILTYNVVPVSSSGCVGASVPVSITINPEPVLSTALDASVCSDGASGITLSTQATSVAAATYNIVGITVAAGLTGGGANAAVPASGVSATYIKGDTYTNLTNGSLTVVYQIVPTSSAGCLGSPPVPVTLTVLPEPVVSNSLNASLCSESPINLNLSTTATSVAAASYDITVRSIDPGLTAGAGNATVPASGVSAGYLASDKFTNVGNSALLVKYTVVPHSSAGCIGDPKLVQITINPEPVMSTSLDKTVCSHIAIGLTLNTNGTSVSAANYNISSRVIAAGLTPNVGNASAPATGVAANYFAADVFTNTGSIPLTVVYTVVPVSTGGCLGVSKPVTITINPEPVVSNTLSATVCSEAPIALTLTTNGTSVAAATYNITNVTIAAGLIAGGGNATVPFNGVSATYLAADSYANSTGSVTKIVTYAVTPISAAGCLGASRTITVTVNPEPVLSNTLSTNACSGVATGLTLNTNGSSVGASNYTVTNILVDPLLTKGATNAVVAANVAANYLALDKFTNTSANPLNVVYSVVPNSAAGCPGPSEDITVVINPEPVVSATLSTTVCSDLVTGLTLNTNGISVAAAKYNITARTIGSGSLVPAVTNVTVPATGVANTYLSTDQFTNTTTAAINVTYTVVPISAGGCVGAPSVITVAINPEPVVSATLDAAVCSDLSIGLTLATSSTSVGAANYNITGRTIPAGLTANGSNVAVPATGVAAAYLATDKFTNVGATSLAVTYTIVPVSAAGCLGNPKIVTITVNPKPVVSTTLNGTVCSDAAVGLTLNTNGTSIAAASYNISSRVAVAGLTPAGSNVAVPATGVAPGYLAADKFTNLTTSALNVTYTVVPVSAGGCLGDPKPIIISINPEPVLSATLALTQCSDVATGLVLGTKATSVAAPNYNITAITLQAGLVAAGSNGTVPSSGVNANFLASDKFTNTGSTSLTATYTVVPVSGSSCLGDPVLVVVTINPEPVASTTLNATVCSDVNINLLLNTNGVSVAATKYNFTAVSFPGALTPKGTNKALASGVAANYLVTDAYTNISSSSQDVVYSVTPVSAAGCLGDSKDITITINPKPVVSTTLNATVCSDVATGLTLTTTASSVAAASYMITARTVDPALVANGANAAVPSAAAVPASYLASDKFTNTTTLLKLVTYTVVPTSAAGCPGAPQLITITINPKPVLAVLDATICSDDVTNLTLATVGTSVGAANYNIVSRTTAAGLTPKGTNAVVPATGVVAAYLKADSFTNQTSGNLTVVYNVVPVSSSGCLGPAANITMTIKPEPVLASLDATVCSNVATGLTLSTVGTSVAAANYNITSIVVNAGLTAQLGNAVVATGKAANYLAADKFLNVTSTSHTVVYTIVPVSGLACLGDPSTVTITINPQPVVSTTLDKTICSTAVTGLNLTTVATSVAATTYNITSIVIAPGLTPMAGNAVAASNVASGYLSSDSFTNTTAGNLTVTYNVVPVSSANCLGASQAIIITVTPQPVLSTALDKTVCSRAASGISLTVASGSAPATTFNITAVSVQAGLTVVTAPSIPATGVPSGYLATASYSNTGNIALVVQYTVVPVSGAGCAGNPVIVKQTVNPEPVLATLDNTVCSKSTIGLTLNTNGASVTAANYNISSVTFAGLTAVAGNAVVPSAGKAANYLLSDKYINTGTTPLPVKYVVVPVSSAGCLGAASTVTITINPEPVLSGTLSTTVCSENISGITLATVATSVAAANYNIASIVIGGGLIPNASNAVVANGVSAGAIKNDSYINTTNAGIIVTYSIIPVSAAGCLGNPVAVVLTVNPEPVMDPTLANKTICSRDLTNITLNTNGISVGAATYNVTVISQDPGLTGTPTTGTGLAATAIKGDNFVNVTSNPLQIKYQIVPKSIGGGCLGQPFQITVTVNAEPVLNASLDNTVCSRDASGITLGGDGVSVLANSYKLVSVTVPGTITADPANITAGSTGGPTLIKNDKFTNKTAGAVIVSYSIVGISQPGCPGQPKTINLTINPEPTLAPGTATLCSDVPSGIVLGPAAGTPAITSYILKNISLAAGLTPSGSPSNAGLGTYTVNDFLKLDQFTNTTSSPLQVTYTLNAVAAGCAGVDQTVVFTVNPAPAIASNLDKSVCINDASGILFATDPSSPPAGSYTITSVTITAPLVQVAGNSGPRTGVAASEIQNDKFTNPTNSPLTVVYHVKAVTGAPANCVGPNKDIILTIEPTITAAPVNHKTDICSGDVTDIQLLSPTKPTAGPVTFNYTASSTAGVSGFIPAVSNLPDSVRITDILVNNSNKAATVTYTITAVANGAKGGAGCPGAPVIVKVIVEPKPKMVASPLVETVCSGAAAAIVLTTPTIPSAGVMQFVVDSLTVTGGMTLTSPATPKKIYASGESIVDVWSNADTLQHSVIYYFHPAVNGGLNCAGDVVIVTLDVNPLPHVKASVQAPICSNDFISIDLSSSVAGTINKWTTTVTPAGAVSGAGGGSGDQIFQTLKNTTTSPATVHYLVTPTASKCAGPPLTVDVIVNPIPALDAIPASATVCYGGTLSQPLSSPVAGTTFKWTVDPFPNSEGVSALDSGNLITAVLTNNSGSQDFLTYTILATGPAPTLCQSPPKIFSVIAAPKINVSFLNPDTTFLCLENNKDFLQVQLDGQAPFTFTYSINDTLQTALTKVGGFKSIAIKPTIQTVYKIVSVKDAFGCTFAGPFPKVVYEVGSTDATFTIDGPAASCSPYTASLKYNLKNGTEYTWRWGDGSPDSVFTYAGANVTGAHITHTYTNTSPTGTLKPKIILQTDLPVNFPGCVKSTTLPVTIYPTIITNVYPDKTEICSGEEVIFTNQSFGVPANGHKWFYQIHGTSTQQDIRTTQSVQYVLNNTTSSNPVLIDVIYQATNGFCPAAPDTMQIKVYRSAIAAFDFGGTLPTVHHYLVGGVAPITFTNNTFAPGAPDPAFKYDWSFGVGATPSDTTGNSATYGVNYNSEGVKTVSLTVTNIISPSCTNTLTQNVTIELLPLMAAFVAGPPEACFPSDIVVTSNTSTGDVMRWQLYDQNGSLQSVSNLNTPTFHITSPGTYTLDLRTSDSQTGQFKDAPAQTFIVDETPFAAFQALPKIVFVPNTPITLINNSAGADSYHWDYGDQNATSDQIDGTVPDPANPGKFIAYSYKIEGQYTITLLASQDHGNGIVCTDTATQVVIARQGGVSKIPNAFSPDPNGSSGGHSKSGSNYDVFLPSIKGVEEYNLQIYDRWGNLLFESNSVEIGWDGYRDGKLLPAGVYVYKITLRLSDGQRTTQIGDVTMIR